MDVPVAPLGAVTTLSYDAAGNLVRTQDPQGGVTEYFYDTRRQLIRTRDPLGSITAYSYDPNGNPASMTDGNGNTTTYAYNYHGQVAQSTDALGGVTDFVYGGTGCSSCGGGTDKLTALTDAKRQTTMFEYDPLGRLIKETDPLGQATSYAYDSRGNRIAKTDALGQTIAYRYDALNRLKEKSYPDGSSDLFEYDARGNLTRAENSLISYAFTYDALNRLIEVTDRDNRTIQYTYDANSNRLSLTDPLGRTIQYSYNQLGRLSGLETPAGSFSFGYDSLGRRAALTFPNGLSSAATFDAASNLSSLAFKDATATLTSTTYAYDRIGNQVAAISSPSKDNLPIPPFGHSTYDAGNRLLDDGIYQYDYDNKGNLVAKIKTATMEMTTYSWDAEGRLIRVHLPDGTTAQYAYDPFGRRIEKSVTGTITRYLYDASSGAILLEYDGAGAVVRAYTYGLGVGDPLIMESGGNAYFYLNDHLGTPQQLVDQSGAVVWSAVYDAYGEAYQDVALVENNLRFPGQYFDAETGLHYNWHRYYDPSTGRYLTPDPIGLDGGINLYTYVKDDPVNYTDPWGLFQFGTRPLAGTPRQLPLGNTNIGLLHENGFYDNGGNVGYFPSGIGPDNPAALGNYQRTGPIYNDAIMRQAEQNLRNNGHWLPDDPNEPWYSNSNPNDYDLTLHNCQDFTDALRAEYRRLGGSTTPAP
jgi:RHS repeat-associated protein